MTFDDFFYLNIKQEHLKNEDNLIELAIEYVDTITKILSKKNLPKFTYQTVLETLLDAQKLCDTLVQEIQESKDFMNALPAHKMLTGLSKDNQFEYQRFNFVFCGLNKHLMPKTKATANVQHMEDLLYLGYQHIEGQEEPAYLAMPKGSNILVNLDDTSPNLFSMRAGINAKLSHHRGAIIIDQSKDGVSEEWIRDALRFYDRNKDYIKTDNFDFDLKKAILENQIVHVFLKPTMVKKSEEMLNAFSEKLLETLAELPENDIPFYIFSFDCERALSETWLDMLNKLDGQKQWLNTYILSHKPHLLPERYFKEIPYKLLSRSEFENQLCKVPYLDSLPDFKDVLKMLDSYQNLFMQGDTFCVQDVGL